VKVFVGGEIVSNLLIMTLSNEIDRFLGFGSFDCRFGIDFRGRVRLFRFFLFIGDSFGFALHEKPNEGIQLVSPDLWG